MELKYSSVNKKMDEERVKYTRKCSCGHSVVLFPGMRKDYIICSWCYKKVFKDIEKQKIQDEKIKKEAFRMKMRSLCSDR